MYPYMAVKMLKVFLLNIHEVYQWLNYLSILDLWG